MLRCGSGVPTLAVVEAAPALDVTSKEGLSGIEGPLCEPGRHALTRITAK